MRRPGKAGGKSPKTQRRKTVRPRRAPKAALRRGSHAIGKDTDVEQLTRELTEAREREAATEEVLKVISSSPGKLEPVFNAMLANATRICEATFGNLFLCEGPIFRAVAVHSVQSFSDNMRRNPVIDLREHPGIPLDRVANTKQFAHIPDLGTDQSYIARDSGIVTLVETVGARTFLVVPMLKEGELIGAISMYRQEARPFTDKQIELVKNFAAQAVIAIENTRLLNELRESLQQQTATSDVLKVISSSLNDLKPVFDTIGQRAEKLCDAEIGVISVLDGDEIRLVSIDGYSETGVEAVRKLFPMRRDAETVTARTFRSGAICHIPDVLEDPLYEAKDTARTSGYRGCLGVPMIRDGHVIGMIFVARKYPGPFADSQIQLLKTFADQAVVAIENVRLFNELRESLQQQTATADVLKVISSSPGEVELVFNAMLANATRICEASYGTLYLREGDGYRAAARQGHPPDIAKQKWWTGEHFKPRPDVPLSRCARTLAPVHVADMRQEPAYLEGEPWMVAGVDAAQLRSLIVVPMLKEREHIGAIAIYRTEVRPFTDKQIDLLTNFADQAVIAIENTRLLSELRESLQQQTATADVLKVISRSTFDLQTVLDTLVESAARLCGAEMANIWRPKDGAYRLTASYGVTTRYKEYLENKEFLNSIAIEPSRGTMVGRVLLERKTVHMHDIQADPDYKLSGLVALGGYRTMLGVPMLRQGDPIGVLVLVQSTVRPFTDKQIELATTFADQAVIAIENVRLFEEVQARTRELSESLEQQTATADVLKVISRSAFDLKTVLDILLHSAARLCEADQGTITQRKGELFYRSVAFGYPQAFMDYVKDIPVELKRDTGTGRALLDSKVVHIPDVRCDPEYTWSRAQELGGFRTLLGVPMLREGEPIGVLTLTRNEVRPFTEKQIELVTTFADQAAIAIENVRLFESVEARTRELAKSLEDLRTTQDRLVQTQKLASLGQLTAGIAHEIKNPLNFVNNFSGVSAELIDELQDALKGLTIDQKARAEINELADTLRGNLDKVVQHGKRADAIVKNMLMHSHQGSGEHRPVAINTIVEESLKLAYHGARAEKQNFNIVVEQSFDPVAGEADIFPQEITRVLLNLISNGVYATREKTPPDGEIYRPTLVASTKSLGDRVEIRIRDNGIGIPSDVKEKMFNPFFTTKPAGEGTGLGLSISHDIIVKQHGGSIEIDTQPGEFTEIRIVLPRKASLSS
jgi:two-component system, NtrC family, sensor kinase